VGSARRSTIYLDADLHRRIRLAGADGDRTISELVNTAVAHFLATGGEAAGPAPAAAVVPPPAPAVGGAVAAAGAAPAVAGAPTVGFPALREPAALPPAGLAPPVRRLFGALRPADGDQAAAQAARLERQAR
jgi:hypothetical protein